MLVGFAPVTINNECFTATKCSKYSEIIMLVLVTRAYVSPIGLLNIFCTGAIAVELDTKVSKICQTQPYALLCDESGNIKTHKEFVISVRIYDKTLMQVGTKFLDICNMGTAENLYETLSSVLR